MTSNIVYYRRQNYKGWHGPARILGKEGQCVLIRYGGTFYRKTSMSLNEGKQTIGKSKE